MAISKLPGSDWFFQNSAAWPVTWTTYLTYPVLKAIGSCLGSRQLADDQFRNLAILGHLTLIRIIQAWVNFLRIFRIRFLKIYSKLCKILSNLFKTRSDSSRLVQDFQNFSIPTCSRFGATLLVQDSVRLRCYFWIIFSWNAAIGGAFASSLSPCACAWLVD